MLHSYETRAPGEPEALCVFFHDTIIHEIFPRIVPLFGQLQAASGFLIMAFLAQRFPVCLIPEQPLVTPVRNDMIHHGRRDDLSLRLTESTERMLF